MPKKLTVVGVLAAIVLGAVGFMHADTTQAGPGGAVQNFEVNASICYGAFPSAGGVCPGSSASEVATSALKTTTISDSGGIDGTQTTIGVASTAGWPASGQAYIAAEWDDSTGTDPGQLDEADTFDASEVVTYTGTTASSLTGVTRNVNDGPSGHPKSDGVTIASGFQYNTISLDYGSRLTLPVTYTPGDFPLTAATAFDASGDVTAFTDTFCDALNEDILSDTSVAPTADWPGGGTTPYGFLNQGTTAGSGDGDGSAEDNYLLSIKPTPPSFTPISHEKALLLKLYQNPGNILLDLPLLQNGEGTPLNTMTEGSPYTAGLRTAVALLAGNPNPPSAAGNICLDSPQDSVAASILVNTPAAPGLYARWTVFTSAIDHRNGSISRILDLQCVDVGASAGPADDDDGDCIVDGSDPTPLVADADGDELPDGVELEYGTDPTDPDSDDDGADDMVEMTLFTRPSTSSAGFDADCNAVAAVLSPTALPGSAAYIAFDSPYNNAADTDCDGQRDAPDNGADENTVNSNLQVDDTDADDGCPIDYDPPGSTLLDGALASGILPPDGDASTITVDSTDTFPNWGFVRVDTEIIYYTSKTATTLVGIDRGANATAGAAHADNAVVSGLTQWNSDNLPIRAWRITTAGATFPAGDHTNVMSDANGDACDTDDDGDGIGDVAEAADLDNNGSLEDGLFIRGTATSSGFCAGDTQGGTAVLVAADGDREQRDRDEDLMLDGAECRLSNGDPTDPGFPTGASFPPGGDRLTVGYERFFNTFNINCDDGDGIDYSPGSCTGGATGEVNDLDGINSADADGDGDTDSDTNPSVAPTILDGIQDGVEALYYGSEPSNDDSNVNGCTDGREVADVNGTRTVDVGDLGQVQNARSFFTPSGDSYRSGGNTTAVDDIRLANMDPIKDFTIAVNDLGFVAGRFGSCGANVGRDISGAVNGDTSPQD